MGALQQVLNEKAPFPTGFLHNPLPLVLIKYIKKISCSTHQIPTYDELLELINRAKARLSLNWSFPKREITYGRLDERYHFACMVLSTLSYLTMEGLCEQYYGRIPWVWNLASYLSPGTSSSLKVHVLQHYGQRGCSGRLVYSTTAVMQAYQSDLLKDLD